ncbi:MAG: tfuA protein [Rhodobacteraceae bacterium]|nr:MAG: tfuA protein [Paracoccaceae bacterium]
MSAIIYLGPSAPVSEARALLDADYRPPVRHGDIWRALADRPRVIGIADGVFEQTPAVWHKEILAALDAGVHVFGAASMGALRAAELHPFGMRGVGPIFEAFRDGTWTDDDEVALAHGPAETGYAALSLPMANVRFTVEAARRAGVIDDGSAQALIGAAKAIFYADRRWRTVDAAATVSPQALEAFKAWRETGCVDQKRADAVAMVASIRAFLAEDPPPFSPRFVYERTDLAEHARRIALGG